MVVHTPVISMSRGPVPGPLLVTMLCWDFPEGLHTCPRGSFPSSGSRACGPTAFPVTLLSWPHLLLNLQGLVFTKTFLLTHVPAVF